MMDEESTRNFGRLEKILHNIYPEILSMFICYLDNYHQLLQEGEFLFNQLA